MKRFAHENNYAFSSFPTKSSQYHNDDINEKNNNDIDKTSLASSDKQPLVFSALQYVDYMTPPENERLEIISKAHLLGHVGVNAIEQIIHNDYRLHWTNMRKDITAVVKDCSACQAYNISTIGYHPPRSVVPDGVLITFVLTLGILLLHLVMAIILCLSL